MTARTDAADASAATADFSAYTYRLPRAHIALTPARPRSAARLLVLPPPESGEGLDDRRIADLPQILRAGDMLVVNDTQVLPHYLPLTRQSGGRVALTLIAPLAEPDTKPKSKTVRWRAFLRPARKVKIGETLQFGRIALTLVSRQGRGGGGVCPVRRTSQRRSSAMGRCRCRLTSRRGARRPHKTARIIRPCLRAHRARSPRPRQGCISRPLCAALSRRAGLSFLPCACMSGSALLRRSPRHNGSRRNWRRNGASSAPTWPPRSIAAAPRDAA